MVKSQSISLHLLSRVQLVGLVMILCNGCASDGVREQAARDRKTQRIETSLIAAGDADSLAAAAMLSFGPTFTPVQRLTLMTRAVTEAPDRPDLVWLNLRLCNEVEGCDPEPLELHLRALDPDNGAAWFDSMGRAGRRHDVDAVNQGLSAIAASRRFDTYWNVTIVHITNAIVKTHTMDLRSALVTAIGVASAIAIPAYQTILDACKGDRLQDAGVARYLPAGIDGHARRGHLFDRNGRHRHRQAGVAGRQPHVRRCTQRETGGPLSNGRGCKT